MVGNGSLMLITAIGVCLLMPRGCWAVWLFFLLLVVFFWCSGASAFSFPSALCSFCSWVVLCFALQVFFFFLFFFFFFSLSFSFSSSSWLSFSLAVCVLCGLLPASLASGLPLCLVWPAPPDLFLLLFLFCPQLCGVGGGGGRAGGG